MSNVVIFAPSPVLTVTVEDHDGAADIHLHAGGQGVWQARMLIRLGATVTMCSVLAGETGNTLRHLIGDEGIHLLDVSGRGRTAAYIHDRRAGERTVIAEIAGEPISRHDLDELYGLTLRAALEDKTVILSGPASDRVLSPDVYRRLAADLGAAGCRVIADLSGQRLDAALAGGLAVVKVSDQELFIDGRIAGHGQKGIIEAMHKLRQDGAANVIITRGHDPSLILVDGTVSEVHIPKLQVADTGGAGDSLTAGVAATLADGGTIEDAVALGTAAGALNVTRHGRGTGEAAAVRKLRELVEIRPIEMAPHPPTQLSPDDLAKRVQET